MARVTLKSGRVQPVWAGHPWIFAQAIERVDGAPAAGDVVEVVDPKGNHLGRGFWSPKSAIPVRIITRRRDEPLDDAALIRRLEAATAMRRDDLRLPNEATNGFRLVHAEGDDLPGLIVDVYGDAVVTQLGTAGLKRHEDVIFGTLMRVTGAKSVIEVPGGGDPSQEGIEAQTRVARGRTVTSLHLWERRFEYELDLEMIQKTGFYFDQRANRAMVERFARDRRVLDLYSYVGAFGLAAARGGAREVQCYDRSARVVAAGATIARANGLADRVAFAQGEVKKVLGKLISDRERFDLVIVDPPKLAPTVRHLRRALTAYRRLNARAMGLVSKNGLMLTCSCSAALKTADFFRVIGLAARDAGRTATVLHVGQQGMDHPVPAAFPEGRYLEAALLRVS